MTDHFCYRCIHYQAVQVKALAYTHACALDQQQFPLTIKCPCFEIAPFWLKIDDENANDQD